MMLPMSRGPTRRVGRMAAAGEVSAEVLKAADHEADLMAHPYIGIEHLELARLSLAGRTVARDALRQEITVGVPSRWWRPRGRNSALRRQRLKQTQVAQQIAERLERGDAADAR